MTAGAKGEPKHELRSVELHAIATQARAFIVPLAELGGELPPGTIERFREGTSLVVGLDLVCETADGERHFGMIFGPCVDPNELAGELEGCATTIIQKIAIDLGLDKRDAAETARRIARKDRIESKRATLDHAPHNVTCDFCPRSVSVIVDGVRLCKRHAEEAGERPHGKIA